MLPDGVENYLGEVARVLQPGGRVLATFFILNEASLARLNEREDRESLNIGTGDCWIRYEVRPEIFVGYRESFISSLCESRGLRPWVQYGDWASNDPPEAGRQDLLIAEKL
jgi:hypothetical protein